MAVRVQAKVRDHGLELQPRLNAGPGCDAQCPEMVYVYCGAVNEPYLF